MTYGDKPASLTLVKAVTNDNGGLRTPSEWTLTANGGAAGTLTGAGPSVASGATFKAGTYTLTESGPSDYSSSGYSCVKNGGAATPASSITLANGDAATCTITNDDKPASLTLVKTVTNDNGDRKSVV